MNKTSIFLKSLILRIGKLEQQNTKLKKHIKLAITPYELKYPPQIWGKILEVNNSKMELRIRINPKYFKENHIIKILNVKTEKLK